MGRLSPFEENVSSLTKLRIDSLEQGTLSWMNMQYQWEGEERFTDMSQDESLV